MSDFVEKEMHTDFSTSVSTTSKTPLYHQIYMVFRQKIVDGTYGFGDLLSGEIEIADEYNVSRITAKRALNELASDGFVTRERGRGTQVCYRPSAAPIESSVDGLLENLLAMGLETKIALLDFAYEPADKEVSASLGLDRGDEVQRAVRVRYLDGEPLSYLTTYVPKDVGVRFNSKDLSKYPLLALLEQAGVKVTAANQTITATLADAAVAENLGVAVGDALLKISRVVFDQDRRPVEYINALYRPDRYQYRMTLSRNYSEEGDDGNIGTWSSQ